MKKYILYSGINGYPKRWLIGIYAVKAALLQNMWRTAFTLVLQYPAMKEQRWDIKCTINGQIKNTLTD